MLCENCPLCASDYNDYLGDGDIYCLVTGENLLGEGGCRRTNKFILSQNRQQLIDKLYEEEAKKWSEYAKQFEQPQQNRNSNDKNIKWERNEHDRA